MPSQKCGTRCVCSGKSKDTGKRKEPLHGRNEIWNSGCATDTVPFVERAEDTNAHAIASLARLVGLHYQRINV